MGTELSDRIATLNINIIFAESIYDLPDQCQIGLIDLDDEKFGTEQFVSELNSQTKMTLLGYMEKVQKESRDKLKAAGCGMILPKASVVKNIYSLVKELLK